MTPTAPAAERAAAILVVYRLESPVAPVLAALKMSVAITVVVDNAEQPHAELPAVVAAHGAHLIVARNRGGLAGAYNSALDWLVEREPALQVARVVLLDEDSDPTALCRFLRDPEVCAMLADSGTAAVSPAYRDRATGLRGKYIEWNCRRLQHLPREFEGLRQVAFVINSMSVWRVPALRRLGRFDERLAIDHVDTDYCMRARAAGMRLWVHGSHEFAHAIGQRRRFRLLGRELQAGGHSPSRRRMIARNTVWLARRWWRQEPAFAALCLARLAYEATGICLAEDNRLGKLRALAIGFVEGLCRRPD